MKRTSPALFAALLALLLPREALTDDVRIDYLQQIKPVLRARCRACHGALKQEGGLRLDTAALALRGGDSGAVIKPGDPDGSSLLRRVLSQDDSERMPPDSEPLRPEEVAALRHWISQNAPAPEEETPEADPRSHWAFQTPIRPNIPEVAAAEWNQNPIDAFLAREHERAGLSPQPLADRRVWLRRVTLDLTGIPPTVPEQDDFVADTSPEAYQKVVDRLLDSPRYGERWGRHWMDIWRYSDWWGLGAEVRNSQKHIWHWRDWIIESLNADKPYDQMLREMLAADELYPNDLNRLRATGYLARQYFIFNRTAWLDETVEHTAKGMLGLTLNCAKCHDHKYDPLSQVEYYQFRALFEPYQVRAEMVPGQTDFEKDGIPRAFDAHLDVPTYLHVRGDDRNPDESRSLEPAVPALLTSDALQLAIEPVSLPPESVHPGLRDFVVSAHRSAAEDQLAAARSALDTARGRLAEVEAAATPVKPALTESATATSASEPKPAEAKLAEAIIKDDFASERADLWEQLAGQWRYENGRLVQSQSGATRAVVRLKQQPPADFEARLKYIPTGGNQWKSVGISFDVTADGNELLAYVSAYAGGPKSQIAYKQGDAYAYPPAGSQPRKVELNQPHEMVLRLRGSLLNLAVDGEHSLAFQLPSSVPRKRGFLELITFDATAEFVSFELKELASDERLIPAEAPAVAATAPSAVQPVEQARLGVTIAEKSLHVAEAQLASIEARAVADQATLRVADPISDAAKQLAMGASKSERVLAAARAEEAVSRAELSVLQAAADKRADTEKTLGAARKAFETATAAIEKSSETYTPLPGAKKTQEDYQNRHSDKPFPTTSTGRRSALANWITDPQNPLTARVAANHLWMRHFGQPLVPTVFDFGRKGTPPTHPELLDWLARELVENNWSMKRLHRLIVTSRAYRMSSSVAGAAAASLAADPDNRFYWRMNPVRMEAQAVRDSLLTLAGQLDETMGGPSIPVNDQASRRRSLYFVHSHNENQKFLSMFDDASVLDCYRRAESIVPQQALALENSPLAAEMAVKIAANLAASLAGEAPLDDRAFVRRAFLTVLSTEPTNAESDFVTEMLPRLATAARSAKRPDPEAAARAALILSLLNHNDFVTIR